MDSVIKVVLKDSFEPVRMSVSEFEGILWDEYDTTDDEERQKQIKAQIRKLHIDYGSFHNRPA